MAVASRYRLGKINISLFTGSNRSRKVTTNFSALVERGYYNNTVIIAAFPDCNIIAGNETGLDYSLTSGNSAFADCSRIIHSHNTSGGTDHQWKSAKKQLHDNVGAKRKFGQPFLGVREGALRYAGT